MRRYNADEVSSLRIPAWPSELTSSRCMNQCRMLSSYLICGRRSMIYEHCLLRARLIPKRKAFLCSKSILAFSSITLSTTFSMILVFHVNLMWPMRNDEGTPVLTLYTKQPSTFVNYCSHGSAINKFGAFQQHLTSCDRSAALLIRQPTFKRRT